MRCAALFALLSTVAISQEAARDRGFGRVTDKDGKPWVGAEVHLMHRPHASIADPKFGDTLLLKTDAKGLFKAQLLVGAAYSAWAIGPVEADGSYRITALKTDAVLRSPILLKEGNRQYVRKVRPVPHESWNGHEPLRWRASIEGNQRIGLGQWLIADADGILTLPRWPGRYQFLQAWANDWLAYRLGFTTSETFAKQYGLTLGSKSAKPTDKNVRAQLQAVHELDIPPRRVRDLELTDEKTGAPIADARILIETMPFDLQAHRSSDQGIVHAVYAHDVEVVKRVPFRWLILPPANAEYSLNPTSYKSDDPPVMARQLPDGRTLDGRLLLAGEPVASVPLMLDGSIGSGNGGSWFGVDPRVIPTDPNGTFHVRGRTERYPFRLIAALSPTMRKTLSRDKDWPVAPLAVLHWESSKLPAKLGDIHLESLRGIDVQVTQPDGSPTGSIPVLLTRVGLGSDAPSDPVRVYTDRRGHVRVLAPSSDSVLVHAVTEHGAAWQRLDANSDTVDLRIDPNHVAKIQVVDQQGKPIAGGSLGIVTIDSWGEGDKDLITSMGRMCMVHAFSRMRCRLDANGIGTLIVPMLNASLDLSVDAKGVNARDHLRWQKAVDEPVTIVVERTNGK